MIYETILQDKTQVKHDDHTNKKESASKPELNMIYNTAKIDRKDSFSMQVSSYLSHITRYTMHCWIEPEVVSAYDEVKW